MYTCYYCKNNHKSIQQLITHFRIFCKGSSGTSDFICGEDGCLRHYCSALSFKKHLLKCHTYDSQVGLSKDLPSSVNPPIIMSQSYKEPVASTSQSPDTYNCNVSQVNLSKDLESSITSQIVSQSALSHESAQHTLTLEMSNFVSSLYVDPKIPRNAVQHIITLLQTYMSNTQDVLLQHFRDIIPANEISHNTDEAVKQMLSLNSTVLNDLRTEHVRLKFFKNLGTYIEPLEVKVGQRMENRRSPTGIMSLIPTSSTMQIIPIQLVLQNFFSQKNVLKDTLDYLQSLKNASYPIVNIIQGSIWKEMLIIDTENEITFPIVIYFDDFEIGNPLGSHAGIHKLGGVYLSIPCLPPHYVSLLQNIFVLALFHSSDRIEFGNNLIFQKIIDQLNGLRIHGITIKTNVFEGVIKFRVVTITGDNLGLNCIMGFVESFVANHPCRICNANKDQIKTLYFEDKSLLRNSQNYEEQLLIKNSSLTGIKEKCVWLGLNGFSLFENVAVDVLHDYFEGCCRYVMTFVIVTLVQKYKLISINNLQFKLRTFDYGPDSSSKPTNAVVLDGSTIKLKTSASEMLTLVRYFGLLVGYQVPEGNDVWSLYVTLRRILDKLMTRNVYHDTSEQIKFLVSELNELYNILSKSHLTPKFHFLTHYPEMFKKYGPLIQIWTMRFEAKHKVSKFIARSSSSRVNICKTIAIKNQLILNDMFFKNSPLKYVEIGTKKKITHSTLCNLKLKYPNLSSCQAIYSMSWIKVKGVMFKRHLVVTVNLCELASLPIFGQILDIFVTESDDIFFSCLCLETVDFNEHYFAYEIRKTNNIVLHNYENLLTPMTNTLTVMADLTHYVTLRWTLD